MFPNVLGKQSITSETSQRKFDQENKLASTSKVVVPNRDFTDISGVGQRIAVKIDDILNSNMLKSHLEKDTKLSTIKLFADVWGIARRTTFSALQELVLRLLTSSMQKVTEL